MGCSWHCSARCVATGGSLSPILCVMQTSSTPFCCKSLAHRPARYFLLAKQMQDFTGDLTSDLTSMVHM